jgi:transposase
MARRSIPMIEIDEVLFRWQQRQTQAEIARSLGQSRQTVRKYLRLAQAAGLTRDGDDVQRAQVLTALRAEIATESGATPGGEARQVLAPHTEQIENWLGQDDMTMKQVWRLLRERDVSVSYASVKRFIHHHFPIDKPRVTVRLETPPGRQAQVDFGQVRVSVGGTPRRLWVFVMTLSYSRHRFVRFVERQDLATWIDCHVRAFEFIGGVPETILLDNLRAGVARPDLYDPTINRAYAELERHYGFVADPARVATPQHKGKVERSMPVVRQQLVAGRDYPDVPDLNTKALLWCRDDVGRRLHGTTQEPPLVRFERDEKATLAPLPATAFDPPTWAEAKVHPDHHVVFQRSFYSVPTRYVGKQVLVRAGQRLVEIFCNDELIKSHPRATRRGTWCTDQGDYPPSAQAHLYAHPQYCRRKAVELGVHVARMVDTILSDHALRNLRKAQAVLRLGEKYGAARLDQACQYLLDFDTTEIRRLKWVLEKGVPSLYQPEPDAAPVQPSQQTLAFLHPPESFAATGEAHR